MNINWEDPKYWITCALLLVVGTYLYSKYRKNKRIKVLKKLKFTVKIKLSNIHYRGLTQLAPEIMTPEKLPWGTIKVGRDPEVWWHAKHKTKLCDFSIFKINKYHPDIGENGVTKEWIVASLKVQGIDFGTRKYFQLSQKIPCPDQYHFTDEGVYLVYRDLFFSTNNLKLLVNGISDFTRELGESY